MEIALLVLLFLVGTFWGGMQALTWLDRRRRLGDRHGKNGDKG